MKTLFVGIILLFTGCALTPDQQVISDIATRNVVAQYIQAAKDPAKRAEKLSQAVSRIEASIAIGMTKGSLVELMTSQLDNKDLSPADRLLMKDILDLTTAKLKNPELPDSEALGVVRNFIKQAKFAISLYQ